MGRKVLTELLHMIAGLMAAVAMTAGAAWAYPLGATVIWACGIFAMVATALMGIGPLRRAARADRGGGEGPA